MLIYCFFYLIHFTRISNATHLAQVELFKNMRILGVRDGLFFFLLYLESGFIIRSLPNGS